MGAVFAMTPESGLRFETKYLVEPSVRVAVWYDLLSFMHADSHQQTQSSGYGVDSLYFDTLRFAAYWEKLDGLPRRVKFRIRRYSEEPGVLHFEAKEKIVDRIRKRRTVLEKGEYQAIVDGQIPGRDHVALEAFALERARFGLRPSAIVSYRRQAFVCRYDTSIRVTFDSDLLVQHAAGFERPRSTRYPVLPAGQTILELKWQAGFPHWLHTIVQKYGLRNLPLSKYCLGMDALMRRGAIPYV